ANDAAEFHGEHVDFDPIWSWPKPTRPAGPPIWIGANSKWVFDRVAEYADGWMPIGGLGSGNMDAMQAAFAAKGRDIKDMDLALFGAPADADQLNGRIEQGFDHLIFTLPPATEDKILPLLDKYAQLAQQVRSR
ncbi:MAG: LLM class flavin-dependent oxidoreductase, partial [Pseudomonadota bacterium]